MFQDNSDRSIAKTAASIQVGQLIYTSFQDCGFRMLMTSDTPLYIQRSFVEKIVNARWDPHSPPNPDFRAAYLYQSTSQIHYTIFGWLYYDGKDEFGRFGVPYFIAYYFLDPLNLDQLRLIWSCLQKGPKQCVERNISETEHLDSITLKSSQEYQSTRFGVTLSDEIWHMSQTDLHQNQPIDWFTPHSSSSRSAPPEPPPISQSELPSISQSEPASISQAEPSSRSEPPSISQSKPPPISQPEPQATSQNSSTILPSQRHETTVMSSSDLTVNTNQLEVILQELVNKTMGIQGAALVSEEGNPIISVIGLNDNTSGILAGTILYMARETNNELNWTRVEAVTLRGPDSYVMLNFCQEGVYLLVKSTKIPMGLLEGAVNRGLEKLKTVLNSDGGHATEADKSMELFSPKTEEQRTLMPSQTETHQRQELPATQIPVPINEQETEFTQNKTILEVGSVIEEEPDDDSELRYRGRPANS